MADLLALGEEGLWGREGRFVGKREEGQVCWEGGESRPARRGQEGRSGVLGSRSATGRADVMGEGSMLHVGHCIAILLYVVVSRSAVTAAV